MRFDEAIAEAAAEVNIPVDPTEAVMAGSDCIIVGSGIHKADDPAAAAAAYAEASWNGLLQRNG